MRSIRNQYETLACKLRLFTVTQTNTVYCSGLNSEFVSMKSPSDGKNNHTPLKSEFT